MLRPVTQPSFSGAITYSPVSVVQPHPSLLMNHALTRRILARCDPRETIHDYSYTHYPRAAILWQLRHVQHLLGP